MVDHLDDPVIFDHTRDPVDGSEQGDYRGLWEKHEMTISGNMGNAERMRILERAKLDN